MLDWKEYTDDIQELISEIHSKDDLQKFVDDLKEGLEDEDIQLVEIDSQPCVVYHKVPLESKEDVKRFFTIQKRIPQVHNSVIRVLVDDTEYMGEFADKLNNYLNEQDAVKVFRNVVVMNNKPYFNRTQIKDDFKEIYNLNIIKDMCNSYEITFGGCGIVCDGIALITTSKEFLKDMNRKQYPIEGYIESDGSLYWVNVKESAFTSQKVKNSDIHIKLLKGFQDTSYSVYRMITVFDVGIVHKPYPVAILEDGTYAFYYKKRAPHARRKNCNE